MEDIDNTPKPKRVIKKKAVRMTPKVQNFIIDKICDGYDVATICRKWTDQVPDPKQIYRAGAKNDEFSKRLNEAYGVLMMHRMDKFHEIASTPATELFPKIQDWREASQCKKDVIDELKFTLAKMAPILSNRFKQVQEVNVTGDMKSEISVIKYYSPVALDGNTVNTPVIVDGQVIDKTS